MRGMGRLEAGVGFGSHKLRRVKPSSIWLVYAWQLGRPGAVGLLTDWVDPSLGERVGASIVAET